LAHSSLQIREAASQHCPIPQEEASGSQPEPAGGSQAPATHSKPGGQGDPGSSHPPPTSGAPGSTVTLKYTEGPPAAGCATTCHGPSAAAVVIRKTCALPPMPVTAVAVRPAPALQRAFAAGGSVNVIASPAMGSPVSASTSRTRRAATLVAAAETAALRPSPPMTVAGEGTISSVRRSATMEKLNATGSAPRS